MSMRSQSKPAPAQTQVAQAAPAPRPQIRERKMSPNVVTRVRERLRASLSDELRANLDWLARAALLAA